MDYTSKAEQAAKRRKWDVAGGPELSPALHGPLAQKFAVSGSSLSMNEYKPTGAQPGFSAPAPTHMPAHHHGGPGIGATSGPTPIQQTLGLSNMVSTPVSMSKEALDKAREVAQGLALQMAQAKSVATPAAASQEREVFINDAPANIRARLLMKNVQADIGQKTRTILVVRGRYYAPGQPHDPKEKPLHMYIKPILMPGQTDQQRAACLQAAVNELHTLMGLPVAPVAPPRPHYAAAAAPAYTAVNTAPPPAQATPAIMIYVNVANPPPAFNLPERIRGPGGAFLAHVQSSTGCQAQLRGQGSVLAEGPEPMHVYITAPTQKQVDEAKNLVLDLIKTITDELLRTHSWMASYVAAPSTVPVQTAPPAQTPQASTPHGGSGHPQGSYAVAPQHPHVAPQGVAAGQANAAAPPQHYGQPHAGSAPVPYGAPPGAGAQPAPPPGPYPQAAPAATSAQQPASYAGQAAAYTGHAAAGSLQQAYHGMPPQPTVAQSGQATQPPAGVYLNQPAAAASAPQPAAAATPTTGAAQQGSDQGQAMSYEEHQAAWAAYYAQCAAYYQQQEAALGAAAQQQHDQVQANPGMPAQQQAAAYPQSQQGVGQSYTQPALQGVGSSEVQPQGVQYPQHQAAQQTAYSGYAQAGGQATQSYTQHQPPQPTPPQGQVPAAQSGQYGQPIPQQQGQYVQPATQQGLYGQPPTPQQFGVALQQSQYGQTAPAPPQGQYGQQAHAAAAAPAAGPPGSVHGPRPPPGQPPAPVQQPQYGQPQPQQAQYGQAPAAQQQAQYAQPPPVQAQFGQAAAAAPPQQAGQFGQQQPGQYPGPQQQAPYGQAPMQQQQGLYGQPAAQQGQYGQPTPVTQLAQQPASVYPSQPAPPQGPPPQGAPPPGPYPGQQSPAYGAPPQQQPAPGASVQAQGYSAQGQPNVYGQAGYTAAMSPRGQQPPAPHIGQPQGYQQLYPTAQQQQGPQYGMPQGKQAPPPHAPPAVPPHTPGAPPGSVPGPRPPAGPPPGAAPQGQYGQPPPGQHAQYGQAPPVQEPPRRRFKEFVDKPAGPAQLPGYLSSYINTGGGPQSATANRPVRPAPPPGNPPGVGAMGPPPARPPQGAMGPPPPRPPPQGTMGPPPPKPPQGPMGPPPARQPMGPPPPRFHQGAQAGVMSAGPLPGLAEYGDD